MVAGGDPPGADGTGDALQEIASGLARRRLGSHPPGKVLVTNPLRRDRQPQLLRHLLHQSPVPGRLRSAPAMVQVRDVNRDLELRGSAGQQMQQRDGVGPAGDRGDHAVPGPQHPMTRNVVSEGRL